MLKTNIISFIMRTTEKVSVTFFAFYTCNLIDIVCENMY